MTFHWEFPTITLFLFIKLSNESIAGITYMDDFDFEERYRNAHECDPFYWHPLHLPDHCAKMYEKLIRSNIASQKPVRVVKDREEELVYHLHKIDYEMENDDEDSSDPKVVYEYKTDVIRSRKSPYEEMLDSLRKDVQKQPSSAKIQMVPNLGPAAVYTQLISKKSRNMIEKIAGEYLQITKDLYPESENDYEVKVYPDKKNNKERKKHKNKVLQMDGQQSTTEVNIKKLKGKKKVKTNKLPQVKRKKITDGNMITFIEKKKFTL